MAAERRKDLGLASDPYHAILFPGQGAQRVGMGRELAKACPEARAIFERANDALGFDLAALCFEGPAEELNRTSICQPAILATSMAALEAWRSRGGDPEPVPSAGLSLGEYTALVYAGAITLDDAVPLVHLRGQLMEEAGRENPGTMVAVLGLDRERVNDLLEAAGEHGAAQVANLNAPGQIVVSGSVPAMDWAMKHAKDFGADRGIRLRVSAAFHSRLMAGAAERLGRALGKVAISQPRSPVVSNVTAKFIGTAAEIRGLLVNQLTSPVLWEDSMRFLLASGLRRFVEVGPGTVLAGLLRRIDPTLEAVSLRTPADLDALESEDPPE